MFPLYCFNAITFLKLEYFKKVILDANVDIKTCGVIISEKLGLINYNNKSDKHTYYDFYQNNIKNYGNILLLKK